MSRRSSRLAIAAAALSAALAGCGYTMGSGLPERGVRTVALTLVGNQSYRQRLEVELAAALARELPVSTDLTLARADAADARLEVIVTEADERTLVPGGRAQPVREGAIAAAVQVRLVTRGGRVLLDRPVLDRAEFRSPIGEDLTSARTELADDLARKIALLLDASR